MHLDADRLADAHPPTTSTPEPEPSPTVGKREIEVRMAEWSISMSRTEVLPGRVTFLISNPGTVAHGFEIKSEGPNRGKGGARDEHETRLLQPGDELRLSIPLRKGEYEIECWVGNHDDRGMRARLLVTDDPADPQPPPSAAAGEVTIEGFRFVPDSVTVTAGTEVTWTNRDAADHSVTAEGAFDSGSFGQGATFSQRFDQPGSVGYLCTIHPSMTGEVVVT